LGRENREYVGLEGRKHGKRKLKTSKRIGPFLASRGQCDHGGLLGVRADKNAKFYQSAHLEQLRCS